MSQRSETLARRLIDARAEKDKTKAAATKAEKAFRAAEAELWEHLNETQGKVRAIELDLGGDYGVVKFTRRETVYAQVIDPVLLAAAARDLERDLEWIKQADEATRKSDFREAPLNEAVREILENDGDLPPGLDVRYDRGVTITRKKG